MKPFRFRPALFPQLRICKIRNGFQQKIATRNHIRVKGDDIGGGSQPQGMVQIAGFGPFVVGTVKITNSHFLRQRAHFRPAVIIADPDMHFGSVRIFEVLASVDGFLQQLFRLIISCDKDVDIRKFLL